MRIMEGGVCAAKGFTAGGIHCGIRKNHSKKDLSLIVSAVPASAAAVYTTNLVKGAPLIVTKNHLQNGIAQAVICNSGNANTCNANGIEIAEGMCALVEKQLGISASDVVVASTGVIGQPLNLDPAAEHGSGKSTRCALRTLRGTKACKHCTPWRRRKRDLRFHSGRQGHHANPGLRT